MPVMIGTGVCVTADTRNLNPKNFAWRFLPFSHCFVVSQVLICSYKPVATSSASSSNRYTQNSHDPVHRSAASTLDKKEFKKEEHYNLLLQFAVQTLKHHVFFPRCIDVVYCYYLSGLTLLWTLMCLSIVIDQ